MSWEPPKFVAANPRRVTAYDPGPCDKYDNYSFSNQNYSVPSCDLAEVMTLNWPVATGVNSPSFGPTSVYRGRLTHAKILVIADQTSQDDIFSGRALTGLKGQQLQKWLEGQKAGLDYAILRTTPWDTLGASNEAQLKASAKAQLLKIASLVVDKSKTTLVVGYGTWAAQVADEFAKSKKIQFQALSLPDNAPISAIPREDLPYHSRWWMGTTGNRAVRGVDGTLKKPQPGAQWHYYRVYAPKWNSDPSLLPQLEPSYIQQLQTTISSLIPGLDQ